MIGNKLLSHRSFCSLPTERPRACQDAGNKDGTSNRDPLETPKVSAPDISILHGVRPSTKQGPFLGTSWASTNFITATPSGPPPSRTSMRPQNQHKAAGKAKRRSTRNHHRAIKMGRLEAMPVRKPRVGQRSMRLSTPTLTSTHVPWVSPWSYKRRDSGIEQGDHDTRPRSYVVELHTSYHACIRPCTST